jgi:calcineurin-like phosphoesterase family protein
MRFLFLSCVIPALVGAQTLTPVWIELGPDGSALARVVVEPGTECPSLAADSIPLTMKVRQPIPEGLKPACEATVPVGTRSLRWKKKKLLLPRSPNRVVVIGDTGCRVRGGQFQDCANAARWPFKTVSSEIAKLKPDLIVHVGDYLYRESVCPPFVSGCGGPHGDNWDAWNADFFEPARSALETAPWIFARGNHETCNRSFRGWFYYLDPRSFLSSCRAYTDPYVAHAGELRIGVLDTGSTLDPPQVDPKQIPIYSEQLEKISGHVRWIVDHHPFWGYTALGGKVTATDLTLGPAWARAEPKGVSFVLSGHVHLFEFLSLEDGRPNQVIAGDSGTQLDPGVIVNAPGANVRGVKVRTGEVNLTFGLTELQRTKAGWDLTLRSPVGSIEATCDIPAGAPASCKAPQ